MLKIPKFWIILNLYMVYLPFVYHFFHIFTSQGETYENSISSPFRHAFWKARRRQRNIHQKEPDAFFFCSRLNQPYSRSGVGKSFRGLLWDAGIPYLGKERGPSIHDLRHTFVCHRLNQWASNEVDLTAMLPILSKYLGHTSISATSWYLRLTTEAYPGIVHKMDCFTKGVFPVSWEENDIE